MAESLAEVEGRMHCEAIDGTIDDIHPRGESIEDDRSAHVGFTSLLYSTCAGRLQVFLDHFKRISISKAAIINKFVNEVKRFKLFGASFDDGKLETCLDDEELFQAILLLLFKIALALNKHPAVSNQSLKTVIDRSRLILGTNGHEDESSGSGDDHSDDSGTTTEGKTGELRSMVTMCHRISLLMELLPTLGVAYHLRQALHSTQASNEDAIPQKESARLDTKLNETSSPSPTSLKRDTLHQVDAALSSGRTSEEVKTAREGPSPYTTSSPFSKSLPTAKRIEATRPTAPSRALSNRNQSGRRIDSDSDGDDSDVGFATIQCWIPSSNVELQALAAYLKDFIDDAATIRPSPNPNDAVRAGYTITAKRTLSVAQVRDIIEDSRAWEKEKLVREYRRDPYGYHESDVWEKRKRIGASDPGPSRRTRRTRSPLANAESSRQIQAVDQKGDKGPGRDTKVGAGRDDDDYGEDGYGVVSETPRSWFKMDQFRQGQIRDLPGSKSPTWGTGNKAPHLPGAKYSSKHGISRHDRQDKAGGDKSHQKEKRE